MKIFICKLNCWCHPQGAMVALGFNRGHAVKLMNKRLETAGYDPMPKNKEHVVEEIDPTEHKKGFAVLSFPDKSE